MAGGSYLFINHDATNLKAKNKHAISAHAQTEYHRRRRREDMRLFRESGAQLKGPKTHSEEAEPNIDDDIQPSFNSSWDQTTSSSDEELGWVVETAKRRTPRQTHRSLQTSPSTMMKRGNSDPFGAFAVTIDPLVNELMAFGRDYLLPSLHTTETTRGVDKYSTGAWNDTINALHDQCRAYGCLARCAMTLASITKNPAMTKLAYDYKNRSSVLLRARLCQRQDAHDAQTYKSIFWQLAVELAAENYTGANVHAKMLSTLLQQDETLAGVDLRFLRAVLYMDIQRATMSVSRPSFYQHRWMEIHLQATWEEISILEPRLVELASLRTLDSSVDDPTLRPIFQEILILLDVLNMNFADPSMATSVFPWLAIRSVMSQGQLLNQYHDFAAKAHRAAMRGSSVSGPAHYARVQSHTALAAMYWTRCVSGFENVPIGARTPGSRSAVFKAGPVILAHLQKASMMSESHRQNASYVYRRLRLWALYIGAVTEQANTRYMAEKGFHNIKFAAHAKLMGLRSWEEVRRVLQGFIYSERFRPDGSEWVEKTLNAASAVD